MSDLLKLAERCEALARGPFPKAMILMGIVALGWVIFPAAWDGRLLSFGSTGALMLRTEPASGFGPSGFDRTIAGREP